MSPQGFGLFAAAWVLLAILGLWHDTNVLRKDVEKLKREVQEARRAAR